MKSSERQIHENLARKSGKNGGKQLEWRTPGNIAQWGNTCCGLLWLDRLKLTEARHSRHYSIEVLMNPIFQSGQILKRTNFMTHPIFTIAVECD